MDRKMNLFGFCRWSLAALPVFFALMACDKILPPSGNGVDIPVKIRAVSIAGGAQNKTVTRASGQKRMVGEPVIQDLGDGMLAEFTVEEDVEALRTTTPQPLVSGRKFRVIAIDAATKKLYSYANYTVPSATPQNGEINPDDGFELHVLDGNSHSYDFICISYNSTTLPDDDDYEEGEELPVLSANVSKDIFYWRQEAQTVGSNFSLDIVLSPQFVKVKLKLDVNTNATRTIMSIADDAIHMNVPTSGSFNLAEGTFSGSGSIDFTGWPTTLGTATATSGESTFLPQASDYTLVFDENAAKAEENGSIERSFGPGSAIIPNSQFKAGCSYIIGLKLYRIPRFAGSNIYWNGNELTFDPHGSNTHTKYQGVFFKWGSLIGIAAGPNNEAYDASSTVLYKPTNTSDLPGTARTWEKLTGADDAWSGSDWTAIPYSTTGTTTDKSEKTLLNNPDFTNHKGDICYYIDPAYRMPTGLELDSLLAAGYSSDHGGFTHDDTDIPSTSDNDKAGKYAFKTNYGTLTGFVLPASGHRSYSSGVFYNVGYYGDYWSGSAGSSSSIACCLTFSSSNAYTNYPQRDYGFSVRCVKN